MKKIITLLCAVATLTACDIDRLPYGSMSAEQITQDPTSSLESLVNGCYAQLKSWSDPIIPPAIKLSGHKSRQYIITGTLYFFL